MALISLPSLVRQIISLHVFTERFSKHQEGIITRTGVALSGSSIPEYCRLGKRAKWRERGKRRMNKLRRIVMVDRHELLTPDAVV